MIDDINKNGSVKRANNNQVYMRGNFEFVRFCQWVFDDKKNVYLWYPFTQPFCI